MLDGAARAPHALVRGVNGLEATYPVFQELQLLVKRHRFVLAPTNEDFPKREGRLWDL